jgi:hypothetical protein
MPAAVAPLPTSAGVSLLLPPPARSPLCDLMGLPPSADSLHCLQRLGVQVAPLDLARHELLEKHFGPRAPPQLVETSARQGRGSWYVDTLAAAVVHPIPCFPGDALRGTVTLTAAGDLELESLVIRLECHQWQNHESVT